MARAERTHNTEDADRRALDGSDAVWAAVSTAWGGPQVKAVMRAGGLGMADIRTDAGVETAFAAKLTMPPSPSSSAAGTRSRPSTARRASGDSRSSWCPPTPTTSRRSATTSPTLTWTSSGRVGSSSSRSRPTRSRPSPGSLTEVYWSGSGYRARCRARDDHRPPPGTRIGIIGPPEPPLAR